MASDAVPFTYTGIIRELSYAMESVLWAQNHKEGLSALTQEERESRELANVRVAYGRVKGAFQALMERERDMATEIALRERSSILSLSELERIRATADQSRLPPELRGEL